MTAILRFCKISAIAQKNEISNLLRLFLTVSFLDFSDILSALLEDLYVQYKVLYIYKWKVIIGKGLWVLIYGYSHHNDWET